MNYLVGIILLCSIFQAIEAVRLYENNIEFHYNCGVNFDHPRDFECGCVHGLWKIYGTSCKDVRFVAGENQYCFEISETKVTRVEQLLKDKSEIILQKPDGTLVPLHDEEHIISETDVSTNDQFITGERWTLYDVNGQTVCLDTLPGSYCFFSFEQMNIKAINQMKRGCNNSVDALIPPMECIKIQKENKNICKHRIEKRQIHTHKIQGRVFFGAPGQKLKLFNSTAGSSNDSTLSYDEDYVNATDGESQNNTVNDAIASEIWNFVEAKLDDILGLKNPYDSVEPEAIQGHRVKRRVNPLKKSKGRSITKGKAAAPKLSEPVVSLATTQLFKSPVYQFLELSKEVMRKTCPVSYVNPEFFDLSVSAFIKIQKKHFKFPDDATNYQGYQRIIESFNSCIDNATVFNFTEEKCRSKEKPVSGMYCAFGNCSMEINMYGGFEDFDPIIETVWNIFRNAHAYCFNHFNKMYNDHHRFTMWMIPLFQNQINDIWRNGTAKGIVYGGVFGNQENVQTAVAYCTASSQMITKYPWDLPRPDKIDELSKTPINRKKRETETPETEYQNVDISSQCVTPKVQKCQ